METRLPFSGFYESMWSKEVDSVEEQECERLADEHDINSEEIFEILYKNSKYHRAYEKIAEEYVGYFGNLFEIKLTPAARVMESPREYNFETDRVFGVISTKEAYRIYRQVGKKRMRGMAEAMFRSRDGFISHYRWDLDEWGQLRSWDHNQLYALLCAFVGGADQDQDWEWSLLEDMHEVVNDAYYASVDWNEVYLEIGKLVGAKEKEEELIEEEDDGKKFPAHWQNTQDYVEKYNKLNEVRK